MELINLKKNKEKSVFALKPIWLDLIAVGIFVSVAIFFYYHFVNDYFFSDDFEWLNFGERIKDDISNLIFLHVSSFYSPFVNLFFYIGQSIFPFSYSAYHTLIVFIHVANTSLLYFFLQLILKNRLASFFGALFFCVNVYHYEALVWISAVMHPLVTFWTLLASISYVLFIKNKKDYFLLLAFVSSLAAFFTKESGVAAFAYIFSLYLFYHFKDFYRYKHWKHLLPFAISLFNILLFSYLWQRNTIWITEGIYRINILAFQKMINSVTRLFSSSWSDFIIANNNYNILFLFIIFILPVLFFFVKRKYALSFLLSLCIMIAGFLPSIFFYSGTWNNFSASRYAYLPSVGAAILVATIFLVIYNIKFLKFALVPFYFIIFIYFLNFNYTAVIAKHGEYQRIDKQSRGMLAGFEKYKTEIAEKNKVVLIQSYPFHGNNYYIYMYNLLVDENFAGEWIKELDWDKAFRDYADSAVLLVWDDTRNIFYIANDKYEKNIDPAIKHLVNEKKALKFMQDNSIGITEEEIALIPISLDNLYGRDADGDGLTDSLEDVLETDSANSDTDHDGYDDSLEIENNYPATIGDAEKNIIDKSTSDKYLGKVILQVEKNGEAWYVNPSDGKRYFLGALDNAFLQLYYLGILE